jgi:hypothetical protein
VADLAKMTAIWTALPNGLTGDPASRRVRLSVYVSMRLDTGTADGTLALFPAAIGWPTLLQPGQINLQVQSPGALPVPATIVSPPPDQALWQDLFSATTRVVSHRFDNLTQRPINTYSATSVHDHLRLGHQQVSADSPVALPTRAQLEKAFPDLHQAFRATPPLPSTPVPGATTLLELQQFHRALTQNIFSASDGGDIHQNVARVVSAGRQVAEASVPGTFVAVVPDDGSPEAHFAQLYTFHHREPVDPTNPPPPPPPIDPANVLDFHQALSALAHYPELLRRLGLVLDLEISEGSLPASPLSSGAGRVQIVPVFANPVAFTNFSPSTAYILDGDRIFTAAARNITQPETIAGFLNLALPDEFGLVQIDVDGLGLKTINMVTGNVLQTASNTGPDGTDGLPAPRSPGISVCRSGQADLLAQRFGTALQNNAQLDQDPPQPVTLFDEDVIRGFRLDVFDTQGDWRSLHARTGSYGFTNHPGGPLTLTLADEGFAQPAATQRVDGSSDVQSQLYIHESLAHWQGWSLAAPRPGKTIGDAGPAEVANQAVPGGFGLAVTFTATPGTLPRLRFHHNYQIRARAVDLAGNSVSLAEAVDLLKLLHTLNRPAPVLPANLGDFTYRRFEPVIAPHLVPRERFTEGESLGRMVIRSNAGETAAACASRLMTLVAGKRPQDRVIYTGVNERHATPPKASELSAETHGMLDAAFGAGSDARSVYNLARKEKGRLTDNAITDVVTGTAVPIPDTTGIDPSTGATITRPAVEFVVTANDSNGPNGYAVHHEPQLTLPYLPDPLSRGATLCGVPGVATGQSGILNPQGQLVFVPSTLRPEAIAALGSTTQIDFGASWPERLPFRLQIAEPSNPTDGAEPPDWDPQNRVLTVRLGKAEQASVRLSSFLGQDDLDLLGVWQWILERKAVQGLPPADAVDAQTAVTGAMWMLTPFSEVDLVHAVQQPLVAPQFTALSTPRDPLSTFAYIGATVPVHGKSTAKLDLQASWQESVDDPREPMPAIRSVNAHVFDFTIHLPDETSSSPGGPADIVPVATYDASSDLVTFQAPGADDEIGRTFLARHEFGDTKHRSVSYQCIATTRFREYFPPEIVNDPAQITRTGPASQIDSPSTARPAAPIVLYTIPMFEWSRSTLSSGVQVRHRKGGGVRVYLERPWFSSGDGELLAVILADAVNYPPDDAHRPFVTQWGNDPIFGTRPLTAAPLPANFSRAVTTASGLTLEEISGLAIQPPGLQAAGHRVEFDPDRKLWFCDIQVESDPLVYCPLVRLALARYQSESLVGVELSRIVLADFLPLLPDRTITVTPVADSPVTVDVQLDGLTYSANAWQPGDEAGDHEDLNPTPPLVQVTIEQRIPGAVDDAGWQPADPPIQPQATSAALAGQAVPGPLWSGRVSVPVRGRFRVVVKEFEHFLDDVTFQKTVTVIDPIEGGKHKEVRTFHPGTGRLVFAETIEL